MSLFANTSYDLTAESNISDNSNSSDVEMLFAEESSFAIGIEESESSIAGKARGLDAKVVEPIDGYIETDPSKILDYYEDAPTVNTDEIVSQAELDEIASATIDVDDGIEVIDETNPKLRAVYEYKWNRYNIATTTYYSQGSWSSWSYQGTTTGGFRGYTGASFSSTNGYSLNGTYTTVTKSRPGALYYGSGGSSLSQIQVLSNGAYYTRYLSTTRSTSNSRGNLNAYVTTSNRSSYPDNGSSGGYWYVYQGATAKKVTPIVTFNSFTIPKVGQSVTISGSSTTPCYEMIVHYVAPNGSNYTLGTVNSSYYSKTFTPNQVGTYKMTMYARSFASGDASSVLSSKVYNFTVSQPTYTASYYANGGTGSTAAQSFVSGSQLVLRNNGFTRAGYVFAGWNLNAAGTSSNYNAGGRYTLTSNMNFYAKWTPVAITINEGVNTSITRGINHKFVTSTPGIFRFQMVSGATSSWYVAGENRTINPINLQLSANSSGNHYAVNVPGTGNTTVRIDRLSDIVTESDNNQVYTYMNYRFTPSATSQYTFTAPSGSIIYINGSGGYSPYTTSLNANTQVTVKVAGTTRAANSSLVNLSAKKNNIIPEVKVGTQTVTVGTEYEFKPTAPRTVYRFALDGGTLEIQGSPKSQNPYDTVLNPVTGKNGYKIKVSGTGTTAKLDIYQGSTTNSLINSELWEDVWTGNSMVINTSELNDKEITAITEAARRITYQTDFDANVSITEGWRAYAYSFPAGSTTLANCGVNISGSNNLEVFRLRGGTIRVNRTLINSATEEKTIQVLMHELGHAAGLTDVGKVQYAGKLGDIRLAGFAMYYSHYDFQGSFTISEIRAINDKANSAKTTRNLNQLEAVDPNSELDYDTVVVTSSYSVNDFTDAVQTCDNAVIAKINSISEAQSKDGGFIYRVVNVVVLDDLKGGAPTQLQLIIPGGYYNGINYIHKDTPNYAIGEEVALLINQTDFTPIGSYEPAYMINGGIYSFDMYGSTQSRQFEDTTNFNIVTQINNILADVTKNIN